jgi:hypothetical protein
VTTDEKCETGKKSMKEIQKQVKEEKVMTKLQEGTEYKFRDSATMLGGLQTLSGLEYLHEKGILKKFCEILGDQIFYPEGLKMKVILALYDAQEETSNLPGPAITTAAMLLESYLPSFAFKN